MPTQISRGSGPAQTAVSQRSPSQMADTTSPLHDTNFCQITASSSALLRSNDPTNNERPRGKMNEHSIQERSADLYRSTLKKMHLVTKFKRINPNEKLQNDTGHSPSLPLVPFCPLSLFRVHVMLNHAKPMNTCYMLLLVNRQQQLSTNLEP